MTDGGALGLTARRRVSPHEAPEGPPGAAPGPASGRRGRQKLWRVAKGSPGLRERVVAIMGQLGAMEVLGAVP